jgi:hypothetical protein
MSKNRGFKMKLPGLQFVHPGLNPSQCRLRGCPFDYSKRECEAEIEHTGQAPCENSIRLDEDLEMYRELDEDNASENARQALRNSTRALPGNAQRFIDEALEDL